MDTGSVFGVDVAGWVEQHRNRDTYEVVREAVQNSLDTGADLRVGIDYDKNAVFVEDYDEDGVKDLSHFYNLFSGQKREDHTKRGRFGRGIKEFIAASEDTIISSTGGAVTFSIDTWFDEDRGESEVEAAREIYGVDGEETWRERGTVVFGRNDDWTAEDLVGVQRFVERLWVPEDQEIELELRGDELPEEVAGTGRNRTLTYEKPDDQIRSCLKTMTMEEGTIEERHEHSDVNVKRVDPDEGAIYEMGIPVTMEESFPFVFDVQQKVPVTERRNELEDSYRESLMQELVNERLDMLDDDELAEEYVTQYLSSSTRDIDEEVQKEYISRRFGDLEEMVTYGSQTPGIALDKAKQAGKQMVNVEELGRTVERMLDNYVESAEDWMQRTESGRTIEVVDPTEEQERFLTFVEEELERRSSCYGLDYRIAVITEEEGEEDDTLALHDPDDDTIYFNALNDEWDSVTAKRIGTALHEMAHDRSWTGGHGKGWYKELQGLGGEVIEDLHRQNERLEEDVEELRSEKWEYKHRVDDMYEGPGDYVTSKLSGVRDALGYAASGIRDTLGR